MEIKLINFKQVFFLLAMTIVIAGCSSFSEMNNEDDSSGVNNDGEVSLKGTKWKLAGIVDTRTGDLKVLEPKDCEECYTLMFDTDSTYTGITSTNKFVGALEISTGIIRILGSTKIVEQYDGELYFQTLQTVQSFSLQENVLMMYSNNKKNYLLYKPY